MELDILFVFQLFQMTEEQLAMQLAAQLVAQLAADLVTNCIWSIQATIVVHIRPENAD